MKFIKTCKNGTYNYLSAESMTLSGIKEDFVIDKKLLVRRWIAEGFIQKEQGETSFKLGEWCFNELINRSLIQARKINMYGDVTACQVHDTILDFIVSKSEEENFITVFGDGYQMHGQHSKVRRLSINASSKEKVSTLTQLDLSHVRSVAVFHYSEELPMWSKFSFLRVLDLCGCRQVEGDHLTGIGNLFQLKYLSLRGTGVRELPEQISKLTCLETLDLKMSKVTKLHAGTAKLQGLIYLAVDKGVQLPDGTERMTALEDLDCVDIFKQSINFQEFGQLKNLRNVQLFVSSDNCRDAAEASHYKKYMDDIVSSLCKLGHLHSLSIDGKAESKLDFSMDSGGDAPTGLQKFEITNHFISKVPNWVRSLFNLQFLTLRVKEFEVDDFMALGRLPALVFLRLEAHKCFHGRRISISGADGFQSLRHFDYCCAIPVTFKAGAMPKINKLTLMFSVFKTSQLATNEEFRFPFGVKHLTCLHSVCYLLSYHNFNKEFNKWITEKMTQIMARMSCEQLMLTICEMEAMDQMYMGEHRMEAAARTHLKSPKLTVRRTKEWGISISRTRGAIQEWGIKRELTAVKLKLKRITEGVITELSRNNCPLKGQGNCQCQGLLEAKARLNTLSFNNATSTSQ
ncbi:disease resistance protein RGA5-like isoform X2 [Panicum virgatum]|uniref:disease resistance protein RGA5-like isoform X2 n=1 Tax=Panicum virgatum TaxID=38727 RepID=UPI0019D58D03|nr:disease resistance protein RGA5-like isoform X2 [Panicum virgatum]